MYTDRYRQTIEGLLDLIKSMIDVYSDEVQKLVDEASEFTQNGDYRESDKRLYAAQLLIDLTTKVNANARDKIVELLGDNAV